MTEDISVNMVYSINDVGKFISDNKELLDQYITYKKLSPKYRQYQAMIETANETLT